MSYDFQLVVDCAQPHALADWWAQTLDWQVEPQDEDFIRRMIAEGFATEADTTTHNGAMVWSGGAAIRQPDAQLTGTTGRVLFQQVAEVKTAKNRLHIDVRVGADKLTESVERLLARGATFLHRGQQGPHEWVTMADPEGNEFCLQ